MMLSLAVHSSPAHTTTGAGLTAGWRFSETESEGYASEFGLSRETELEGRVSELGRWERCTG